MTFFGTIKGLDLIFSNKREYLDYLEKNDGKKVTITIERETGVRTRKQNNALHKYFDLLAKELNSAGLDMKKVIKQSVDISWNGNLIKEYIWRPMQKALTGKESTTELDKTSEITEIWEHLNRHFRTKYSIHVPFPSEKKDESTIEYPTENNQTAF